jgi:multiple sugar transport system permease protein
MNKILVLCLGGLFLLPLLVTLSNSFMAKQEIVLNYSSTPSIFDLVDGIVEKFMRMHLIPKQVSAGQYADVLINQPSFLILLTNSLKITVPVTIGSLVIALLSAYGFTICRCKCKEALFTVYIVVMFMPLQAVLVPNYLIAGILGIKDSYWAIILPGIFSPFGVFLARQGMKALPQGYFEAARIDGASNWCIIIHIVIPQMKSTIAALCMLNFIEYWNLVEQALIFIDDYTKEPLSVYLSRLAQGRIGLIFAASCVYMVVPIWFLLLNQEGLEKGIELSGVK